MSCVMTIGQMKPVTLIGLKIYGILLITLLRCTCVCLRFLMLPAVSGCEM